MLLATGTQLMIQPAWSTLAAAALERLQRIATENSTGHLSDHLGWTDPGDGPEDETEILNSPSSPRGDLDDLSSAVPASRHRKSIERDEITVDAGNKGSFSPEAQCPVARPRADRLLLALRLTAMFGSEAAVAAMLRQGAVTVIEHGDVPEADVRRILRDAFLPERVRAVIEWDLRAPAPGSLCTLSVEPAGSYRSSRADRDLSKLLGLDHPVLILIQTAGDLPERFRRILPSPLRLPDVDADILLRLLAVTHPGTRIDPAALPELTRDARTLGRLGDTALLLAFRESDAPNVLQKLATMIETPSETRRPSLDDIEGYGEAEAIARRMVADLQAWRQGEVPWSEVERAVLFFGEPGTGKSFLAQAMAGGADISLVRGGFARWQAAGHLGHMLAAMRTTFAEARAAAPAVLVLDEMDAVGSRTSRDMHNENYRRQVINGFLEELDGLSRMPGVLAVGTCNDPSAIDPAVLRPGRFDRKIEVPLPGRRAIARMLRDGLATTGLALDEAGLARLVRAASGLSAAAIDAALRGARAIARAERRNLTFEDIHSALGRPVASAAVDWRVALHECGHAIVSTALCIGRVTRLVLRPEGGEAWTMREAHGGLLCDWEAELTRVMAGRAAERVVLGDVSSGAGGDSASDLAKGTAIALKIDTHLGLGSEGPLWRGVEPTLYLNSPANTSRIRQRLEEAEGRACAILGRNRHLLNAMAAALLEAGLLEGDELSGWLAKVAPTFDARTGPAPAPSPMMSGKGCSTSSSTPS